MIAPNKIKTLFIDIGGVLLTNGWDHESRNLAADKFNLHKPEMETRHSLAFETFEIGKLTLDEYLNISVFYEPRGFTKEDFWQFMISRSKPYPQMIELIRALKSRYGLKIVVISNEARELNSYRIQQYKLTEFIDFFISSTFAHLRKPDISIYQMALDMAQVRPSETIYIDDVSVFVNVAESLGINGICHVNYDTTVKELKSIGFDTTL